MIKRIVRQVCSVFAIAVVIAEAIATPFADQLKARFNTPAYPIIVSEVAFVLLLAAAVATYAAIINSTGE